MKKLDSQKNAPQLQGRRRLLKTAVIGGAAAAAMPEKWTRPVVDSVLLPAHAETTDQTASDPTLREPDGTGFLVADESFPDIILPTEELNAEQEAAAQAMNLSDILISSAHATGDLSLNFTTRYYIRNIGGGKYHFTSLRIFDTPSGIRWFAEGDLTDGATVGIDTFFNCTPRSYKKQVELVEVTDNNATIKVHVGPLNYTKVIPLNNDASPDSC